jgi:hypothetical protein
MGVGAIPYFRHLIAGFQLWWPGFEPICGHVGFVVGKVAWGTFFLSTSVSPANSHSIECTILTYHLGLEQGAY